MNVKGAVMFWLAMPVFAGGCDPGGARDPADKNTRETARAVVVIGTSMGEIKAELWADKAPATVRNFLQYADDGFYDGTVFHRVIDGFMIQGGGLTAKMVEKPTRAPIRNEAARELQNDRGTLAMARTDDVHSATSQFFINLKDNGFLNHKAPTTEGFGYCAFGRVIEGMDVVDRIAKVRTHTVGRYENVPVDAVEIHSIRRAD